MYICRKHLQIWIIRIDIEEWITHGVKDRDAGMKDTTRDADPNNKPILKLILQLGWRDAE